MFKKYCKKQQTVKSSILDCDRTIIFERQSFVEYNIKVKNINDDTKGCIFLAKSYK